MFQTNDEVTKKIILKKKYTVQQKTMRKYLEA